MLIGVCLDNVDEPAEESWRKLAAMRPRVVGTLWTRVSAADGGTRHGRAVYERLEEVLERPTYHVRVGASRRMGVEEWVEAANAALGEVPAAALTEGRVRLRCLNEVNLEHEGGWEPEEYAGFLAEAVERVSVPLLAAPVSLVVGAREWWLRALAAWGGVVPAAGVCANVYGARVHEVGELLVEGVPWHVTEINTLHARPGGERAGWLVQSLMALEEAGCETAEVFILGGRSHGAWDERYVLTMEECQRLGGWMADASNEEEVVGVEKKQWPVGTGGWVWYVERNGGAAGIVEKAKRAGLSHVFIKGGDGPSAWEQLTPELVAELRAAGLSVLAWVYCYGGYRAGTAHGERRWTVEDEIALARRCLEVGVDGLVADVEAEYEGRPAEAERYAGVVAEACREHGVPFGYSPLPVIDYHTALPFVQFNRACDAVLPQFYSRALGPAWPVETLLAIWDRWKAAWASWGVPVPEMLPVGECFAEAGPADVTRFAAACRARRIRSVSYWSMDEMDAAELDAIATTVFDDGQTLREIEDALHGIWAATERQAALAVETQRRVAAIKGVVGL